MKIDLLYSWGAIAKEYKKNEVLFNEDDVANFYYQVVDGCIRMFNSNDDGKEYTQGYFYNGDSFGEPPLLIDETYPSSAVAFSDSKIIKLTKEKFLKILDENPLVQRECLQLLAQRIHKKAKATKDIINQKPEFRILAFLNSYKKNKEESREIVPFTRQEIANFTGLRVETVIRTFSKMKNAKKIEIINHKIYY